MATVNTGGGEQHTLVDKNGKIYPANHSLAEIQLAKASAALGGPVCPCLQLLFGWRAFLWSSPSHIQARLTDAGNRLIATSVNRSIHRTRESNRRIRNVRRESKPLRFAYLIARAKANLLHLSSGFDRDFVRLALGHYGYLHGEYRKGDAPLHISQPPGRVASAGNIQLHATWFLEVLTGRSFTMSAPDSLYFIAGFLPRRWVQHWQIAPQHRGTFWHRHVDVRDIEQVYRAGNELVLVHRSMPCAQATIGSWWLHREPRIAEVAFDGGKVEFRRWLWPATEMKEGTSWRLSTASAGTRTEAKRPQLLCDHGSQQPSRTVWRVFEVSQPTDIEMQPSTPSPAE